MSTRSALTWFGVSIVVFFVLSSPNDAGGVVHSAFDGIESAANQLAAFVQEIAT